METKREERIQILLQEIRVSERIHLNQAAELLGVSGMTIRRDIGHYPQQLLLLGVILSARPARNRNATLFRTSKTNIQSKNSK